MSKRRGKLGFGDSGVGNRAAATKTAGDQPQASGKDTVAAAARICHLTCTPEAAPALAIRVIHPGTVPLAQWLERWSYEP